MKMNFFEGSELRKRLILFKKEFFWSGIFSMIANVLLLTPTVYMLQIYDHVMVSRSEITLMVVTVVMVLFYAVMSFAEWLRSRLLVRTGVKLDESLNTLVFRASFDSYLRNARINTTDALSNLVTVRQFITGSGIIALFDAPWTPIYIGVTFFLHPYLGFLSIIFACIQLLVTYSANRASKSGIEGETNAVQNSNTFVQSKLRNIEPIHAMGMVSHMRDRWNIYHEASLEREDIIQDKQHRQQSFAKYVRYCMQSFTLGAGGLLVIQGKLSPGAMIAGNVLMARALQPLDLLISTWRQFVQAKMAFEKLEQLLEEYPEREPGAEHPEPRGEIRLEDFTARVASMDRPILDRISAKIPAGSIVVVLGPSGAGKSTLSRSLIGIWPDVEGKMLLDEQPIESWDRAKLGPYIGYLPQDIELFEGTIAENIARFAEIDSEKVIDAARRTGIHEMILRFPKGYDTEIGDAGSILSGGQRQRLALARALYGNPSLVVLDEPNANLDEAGEKSLAQAVNDLKAQGKTVVLVTHRLNLVGLADLLMVLSKGRIVHFGPKQEVLEALKASSVPSTVL